MNLLGKIRKINAKSGLGASACGACYVGDSYDRGYHDLLIYENGHDDKAVFIEFAATIEISSIVDHIHRIIRTYAANEVVFYWLLGTDRQKKKISKIPLSQMWFVYFDSYFAGYFDPEYSVLQRVEKIVHDTEEYHPLGMIICLKNYDKIEFRVKLHKEKTFKKAPF